jgi:gliding motility-associated-like protein
MNTITFFSLKNIKRALIITLFAGFTNISLAQTRVFAQTIVDENIVDFSANAIDADLSTKADIRASTGIAIGVGEYAGHIELKFPTTLSAYTTSYVKIDTEDNLLPALLGGSLGSVLADAIGIVLVGNQEFTVEVKNGATSILSGDSQVENDFASPELKIVINSDNEYFIAITPAQAYDAIRLTSRVGALLGLNNIKKLGVYGAFYVSATDSCGQASFTSYDGVGITLDLINIGGAGVTNPHYAIDNDPTTASELSLGIIGVGASMDQTVYFEGLSQATDNFNIKLRVNASLLALGVANTIIITASAGETVVQTATLSSLLNIDLLTILQSNQSADVAFAPGAPVDRITVSYGALLGVGITQKVDLYDIVRTPTQPTIDIVSQSATACTGTTASLIATSNPTNLELKWYDALVDGNLLATVNSGDTFTTPIITANTTFYVAASKTSCSEESARVAVLVTANTSPISTDILVTGNESTICASNDVVLQPTSGITGSFKWYFENTKAIEITDGLVVSGVTYTIDAGGNLTISGLTEAMSPISYYVSVTDATSGCENLAGNLKEATVTVEDNDLAATLVLDANITADDAINSTEAATTVNITGNVTGDAQIGDTVTLLINNVTYTGLVAADYSFSIAVNGSDLENDADSTIDASIVVTSGACDLTITDTEDYTVDTTAPTTPTVDAQTTNDTTPVITGTADSSDVLTVTVDGTTYTEGDGNLVDNGDDTWTLTIPTALADGTYDVVATATDAVSNTATDVTTDELIIDSTAPTTPTVDAQTTNDTTPVITGTANSSDVLTVTVDGTTYTEGDGNLVDNGDDTWTLTIPTALADGTYDVVATATDAVSNTATDVTTDELIIDSTAPTTNDDIQVFCELNNPTLLDIQVNETNIVWYASSTGGVQLDTNTVLVDGEIYYAALVNGNSESDNRLAISIILESVEEASIIGNTENACLNGILVYETELDKENYRWVVSGGRIIAGGTTSDNFIEVEWTSISNTSIGVTYFNPDGCAIDSTKEVDVKVGSCSDLSITKETSALHPFVKDVITFTINVTNDGETKFDNVVVNEQLRSGFIFIRSYTTLGDYDAATNTWSIDSLPAFGTATLTIDVRIETEGDYYNVAFIASSFPLDNDTTNNSDDLTIVPNCIVVYNQFTPNNDGFNDYFAIDCIEKFENNTLKVFNRYGSLVYQVAGYQNDWKGMANVALVVNRGEALPTGTYFYVLEIEDTKQKLSGWLYLKR